MKIHGVGFIALADRLSSGSAATALVQQAGEDVLGQQADFFGEYGDDALEDEAAGADAVFESGAPRPRQGAGVVAGGGEQVEEKSLGFALFVALELGGELGEVAQPFI